MRVVGFTEAKRVKLENFYKEKQPIKLADFGVQKAYSGEDNLEIVIRDYTTIDTSDKKFDIDIPDPMILQEETHKPKEINLNDLSKQPKYQRIIVTAKVVSVAEIKVLDDYGKQLQTVVIRDKTGEAKFDLWQKHIGTLTLGKIYVISNAMVKIYNEQHSLTTPKDDTLKVEEAEDIPSIIPIKTKKSLCDAQVIGVRTLKSKILCVACSNGGR